MKVWDIKPPSKLMVQLKHAEARRRADANRRKRELFERERIRIMVDGFESFGAIVDGFAILFVYDRRMPENSHIIREELV